MFYKLLQSRKWSENAEYTLYGLLHPLAESLKSKIMMGSQQCSFIAHYNGTDDRIWGKGWGWGENEGGIREMMGLGRGEGGEGGIADYQ